MSLPQTQSLLETLACLTQTACAGDMSIGVSGYFQICTTRLAAGNLDRVAVVKLLSVLEVVVVTHQRAVRHFDATLAVKVALVNGVSFQGTVKGERRFALALEVFSAIVLKSKLESDKCNSGRQLTTPGHCL